MELEKGAWWTWWAGLSLNHALCRSAYTPYGACDRAAVVAWRWRAHGRVRSAGPAAGWSFRAKSGCGVCGRLDAPAYRGPPTPARLVARFHVSFISRFTF